MARATTKTTTAKKTATRSTTAKKAAPKTTATAATTARATKAKTAALKTPAKATKAATKTAAKAPAKAAARTAAPKVSTRTTAKKAAQAASPVSLARELRKKELIDRVTAASGLKKSQARAAIEATLAVIGEAMEKGEAMNLEPLGKVKVQKEKDVGAANVYSCRVRRKKQAGPGENPPLAEAAE